MVLKKRKEKKNDDKNKVFKSSSSFNSIMPESADDVSSEEEGYGDQDLLSVVTSIRLKPTLIDPPPLPQQYWTEPSASSFNVRGANYLKDRKKIPSADNLFQLFAVDLVKVSDPILSGMCNHPDERVQKALRAEKAGRLTSPMPPFIFCVNITLPGSPAHHLVMYYAVDDLSLIAPRSSSDDISTPFNKLASRFFFGDSDEFRDSTFKLIPRIVKGNFLVKNAVGNKPTILGKKLKQHYIQNDRFFELIVDVASDKIAKRVVGLSVGYAKTLVVDMGFVLEGKHKTTLPENMMGTVRLNNIDFKADLRSVKQP
jgi:hypothetical protein